MVLLLPPPDTKNVTIASFVISSSFARGSQIISCAPVGGGRGWMGRGGKDPEETYIIIMLILNDLHR